MSVLETVALGGLLANFAGLEAIFEPLTTSTLAVVALVVLVAGAVNGVAGFGFALVGTMALSTVLEPSTAVVFMIVPILAVNLSLVRELSASEVRTCGRRFRPLLLAATAGTLVGMWALEWLPASPLRVGLGLVTLAFVATNQRIVAMPGLGGVKDHCFIESTRWMTVVGGLSGLVFGATNVGVQLVAYLRSCNLSNGLFVGVIAMVFVGINGLRVVAAATFGLYEVQVAILSLAATVPAVGGVLLGSQLRHRLSERYRHSFVFGLLTLIGVRLLLGGFGVV